MDFTWLLLCCGIVLLPVILGYLWILVYRYRRDLGLPDWLSGILAQGVISGHKIHRGNAKDEDFLFIIGVTAISILVIMCPCVLLVPTKLRQITLSSTVNWQSTGVVLGKNSPVYIAYLSGSWTVDSQRFQFVGPEGYPNDIDGQIWGASQCKIVQSAPYGQLLGGVDSGSVFIVGKGGFFWAPNEGELLLSINDKAPCLTDNQGEVTVLIIAK
jgi:hypothetical protein